MKDQKQNQFEINSRIKSFSFAIKGLRIFFTTQHNAWIHLVAAVIVIGLGFIYKVTVTEWCFLIFAIGFVISAEAINTSIEFLTDLVSPGYNEKAGKVKDIAAGAVLIAAITAFTIGSIIFIPKIF